MRERSVRIALVVVDLFVAVSAVAGAVGLIAGNMVPLSVLRGTAFADFTIPALLLGIVVGGSALAAGGTIAATVQLVERLGGQVVSLAFLIELTALGGRQLLTGRDVYALLAY
ncbi:MAG TPA: hypothetical protein VGR57_10545 [Ktedonobacterales bacterium]|nr:hypothetical protein [Ktedonobacterales bacterium]